MGSGSDKSPSWCLHLWRQGNHMSHLEEMYSNCACNLCAYSSHHQAPEDGMRDRYQHDVQHSCTWGSMSEQEDLHEVNVLHHHHKHNRAPCPPSQEVLKTTCDYHTRCHTSNTVRHDSRSDNDTWLNTQEKKAEKHNFWPSMWKILIDEAKLEWCIYLSVADAFLSPNNAKDGVISNILQQIFQQFSGKVVNLRLATSSITDPSSVSW